MSFYCKAVARTPYGIAHAQRHAIYLLLQDKKQARQNEAPGSL